MWTVENRKRYERSGRSRAYSAAAKWSAACSTTVIRPALVSGATFGRIAGRNAAAAD
jgi:hypothetical protein